MFNKSLKGMDGWEPGHKRSEVKILIDISLIPKHPDVLGPEEARYVRRDRITYEKTSAIIRKGYRQCIGLVDKLDCWGIPVYVAFTGFKKCNYRSGWIDENGNILDGPMDGAYQ